MSSERVNGIAKLLEATMAHTVNAAGEVAADRRMNQAKDAKAHPTWQLGHMTLVMANGVMGLCLAQRPPVPKEYQGMFAPEFLGGQAIQSDASAYPDWDSILETYKAVGKEAVAAVRALDDSELDGAPKGPIPEPLQDRLKILGDSLSFFAMHNAYHTGQMNLLASL